jgi:PadR family transcriptional regulator AphA
MAELTTTSYVILGALVGRDWSAYDLAQQLGRGVGEVWPRAERQLYNAPKRLVSDGYIRATKEPVGQRERTVYSITRKGRAALRRWMATDAEPPSLEFEGMIRVMVAEQGSIEQLRDNLRTMADQARERRDQFSTLADYVLEREGKGTYPERTHLNALAMSFMVSHFDNIIKWANWALECTESWPDTKTPAETWRDESSAIFRRVAKLGRQPHRDDSR